MDQVEKIVTKMKQKYAAAGMEFEGVKGNLGEIRDIIAEGKQKELEVQSVEDLIDFKQAFIRQLGKFYLTFKNPIKPLMKIILNLPQVRRMDYWLVSADMKFSLQQYLAITVSLSIIVFFISFAAAWLLLLLFKIDLAVQALIALLVGIGCSSLSIIVSLLVPKSKAQSRGQSVSEELPFALRHMATELKSGIGLYRTIQAVAVADYGVLSEEFAKTINEVEEGTETKDALSHLASRTQSKQLRNALMHIIRAMKTGGNLSEIMNQIAREASFDLQQRIRDFAEKMNFFGVIFIFIGIVAPVMVSVLGSIKNSPLPLPLNIPLDLTMMALLYVLVMPMILGYLVIYIKSTQPRG
jgi:archaeal flagellar protein FlaJ